MADLPTQTRTPVPPAPVIGGADKIAFLSGHEIWAANLDGTDLVRLASGEEPKAHLQWAPDGEAVLFASTGCLYSAGLERRVVERIACFDPPAEITAFSISADGKQAAIGLDRELFLFPFDLPALKNAASRADLIALAACPYHAPLVFKGWPVAARQVRWSQDGQRLAVLRQAADSSRLVDEVHLLDISGCNGSIRPLDEFPATRFSMPDYTSRPVLQSFGWDGRDLFALYGFKRNDGFGDLWLYDSGQRLALQAQPVPGGCCYRDPHFSPDGEYLLFVYQDRANASQPVGQVYLVPVKAIGSGLIYPPLPVDARLLTDPRGKPQPVLRPAR